MADKEIKLTPLYHDYVLNNKYDVVVQVGGRFSGKSHNEQIRLVSNLASKEQYKLLVIEDLETGMSEGFHAGLYSRIRDFEHDRAYTPETKVAHIRNVINDNTALFRGYSSEQQKLNVKKMSGITEILVEEGEWMTYDDLMSLYQQLRGIKEEDRKLTILLNPVNPNCFVNEHLIEKTPDKILEYFEGTKRPKVFERHITTTFTLDKKEITKTIIILVVLSTHFDNNYLTLEQRASIEQYKETDPEKYLQLGEARFIKPSGTYFKEFSQDIHVIEPFIIPSNWNRFLTIDYGLDMLAAYWVAIDTYNNAYVYKELYESDLIISDAAKKIKYIENGDNVTLRYSPPDLYNRRQDTGKSAVDIFAESGLHFIKATNDRVLGWYNLKEWLKVIEVKDEQTGKPVKTSRLKFFSNCTNIIRTLPQLLRDEKNPNDVASEPHELTHGPDGIRYLLADRPPCSYKEIKKDATFEDEFGRKDSISDSFFE
jgi:phage terminase large subunit